MTWTKEKADEIIAYLPAIHPGMRYKIRDALSEIERLQGELAHEKGKKDTVFELLTTTIIRRNETIASLRELVGEL